MVKVRVSKKYHDYIDFQTVSLEYGHSQHFLLSWHDFEKLDRGEDVIAKSLQREDGATPCKAYFYRKAWAGELAVSFFWRDERRIKYNEDGSKDNEYGSEHVLLPYDDLYAFIREQSWSGAPSEWKCLALEESKQSRLVFVEKRNLRKCLSNKLIRKKLVRFLRDRFCDPDVPQVNFYDRAVPYSFTFEDICGTAFQTVGAVTLLHADDLEKARFCFTSRKEQNPRSMDIFSHFIRT